MFLMDRTLRTVVLFAPERRTKHDSNRDSNAQTNRNMPGQNSRDRAQRRS